MLNLAPDDDRLPRPWRGLAVLAVGLAGLLLSDLVLRAIDFALAAGAGRWRP